MIWQYVALMKKCREKNFNYLISPYESGSQLTYLQKIDIIDFIMSEDSDLLVFSDPEFTKVIFKTNFDTESGNLIVLKDIFGSSADDKFLHSHKICSELCVFCLVVITWHP